MINSNIKDRKDVGVQNADKVEILVETKTGEGEGGLFLVGRFHPFIGHEGP
jgi:hypothetical protein